MNDFFNKLKSYLIIKFKILYKYNRKIIKYPTSIQKYSSRIPNNIEKNAKDKNIVLTTYFTSKIDPQRKISVDKDNFDYIKDFYKSVIENNLNSVIFYDILSEEFIKKYSCSNVTFIKCKLLHYSLNDERFFIYQEFLQNNKFDKVLICDVSDVIFGNQNVFKYLIKNRLYIGRDEKWNIGQNNWIKNKIKILPKRISNNLPDAFYDMPLVNAGVFGGEYRVIVGFLNNINYVLNEINNNLNNNMIVVNIVFYDRYWINFSKSIKYKIIKLRNNYFIKFSNKDNYKCDYFYIGRPFTSNFKKYEINTGCWIYHK